MLLSAILTLGILFLLGSWLFSPPARDSAWSRGWKSWWGILLNPWLRWLDQEPMRLFPGGPDDNTLRQWLDRVDDLRRALAEACAHPALDPKRRDAVRDVGRDTANQLVDAAWRLSRLRRLQAVLAEDSAEYRELADIARQFLAELEGAVHGLETLSVSTIRLNFSGGDELLGEVIEALRATNRRVDDLIQARNLVK